MMEFNQSGELWRNLYAIGAETEETRSPPAFDWLIMHGFVENSAQGPQLTEKGQKAFKVMETDRGTVLEFDGDLEM